MSQRAREWMETQRNTGIFSSQHEDAYDLLAAYHAHASAEERRRRQAGKTHWDGCWKDHLDCAVEKIETAEKDAEIAALRRILIDGIKSVGGNATDDVSDGSATLIAKKLAAREFRIDKLEEILGTYSLRRYAHTFQHMKECLGEAVLLINGMIERDPALVEHWRLLTQTCDADHLTSCANKLESALNQKESQEEKQ